MFEQRLVVALVAPILLATIVAARAQEQQAFTPQPASRGPQTQWVTSGRSTPYCSSRLGCFLSGIELPPENGPEHAQSAQPPVPATPANPRLPLPARHVSPAVERRKIEAPRSITIAADGNEVARLKGLGAALPNEKVRFVKASENRDADLSVTTMLDGNKSAGKTEMFFEQLHIIATKQVGSIADLKGKIVSFGPANSASQAAARKAFAALDIHVKETPLDLDNALDGLATGDIAAVVVLAPQPLQQLARLSTPGLHFVSWPRGAPLPIGASLSSIEAARYPNLAKSGEAIPAVGVAASLEAGARCARQPVCKTFLSALALRSRALVGHGFELLGADREHLGGRQIAKGPER